MKLSRIEIENCRNIQQLVLEADPALTVIGGSNGQGKTSLLECIWLLTGGKSFRGAKDQDLVREGAAFGRVVGNTATEARANSIEVLILGEGESRRGRFGRVNGVDYGRAAAMAGIFTCVVFDPGHLMLIKSGPEARRRFLDGALCQLYPNYIKTYRRYARALGQKNVLLKKYHQTHDADALLDVFDAEMSESGREIIERRATYMRELSPQAQQFYAEISQGAEAMELRYCPSATAENFSDRLRATRSEAIRAGFSTVGPHRDDLSVELNGRSARQFGSQGQQRSAALSLKLAEAAVARQVTGEHPVMLLDDVLSELDPDRQGYLLSRMSGRQCFVTTCDTAGFSRTAGKVITIQNGAIES